MISILKYIEKSYEKAIVREYKRLAKRKRAKKTSKENKGLDGSKQDKNTAESVKLNLKDILNTCSIMWNKLSEVSDEQERKNIIDGMYSIARNETINKAIVDKQGMSYDNLIKSWLRIIEMNPVKKDFKDKTAFDFEITKDLSQIKDEKEMADILNVLSKNVLDDVNGVNIPRMIFMGNYIAVNTKLIQEENKIILKIYMKNI